MNSFKMTVHYKGIAATMAQAPAVLTKHMSLGTLRLTKTVERDAKRFVPKAFSTLTHSINHRMVNPLLGEVYTGMDYARMVDEGTGPGGWPSDQAMLDWIRVKNIVPNDPRMDEADLAFLFARSIALHGTPKQPYMKPALAANVALGNRLAEQAIKDTVKELNA